jgi:hypothetical protein
MRKKNLTTEDYKLANELRAKALEPVKVDRLSDLMKYPNDYETMQDLVAASSGYKLLTGGRAIWAETLNAGANQGKPYALHNLPYDQLSIIAKTNVFPIVEAGYTMTVEAGLNFSSKMPILVGNPYITEIGLNDPQVVVVEIQGPVEYDLTLDFNLPNGLSYLGNDTGTLVPVGIRYAYSNTGEPTSVAGRSYAVEVPPLFRSIQFPLRKRRLGGPPPPPPTPMHGGYTRLRDKAYVYVYGNLGPVPSSILPGLYSGLITLTVSYADNTL